jgi:3-phenylpropionate/trans-cinnamate dioxygenase ferredoxin reductase subunit
VTRGVVVVGASVAGVRTAEALRRRGYEGPITVLSAEPHAPYDRPPLSKEFLLGKVDTQELALTRDDALAELGIALRLNTPAIGLDLAPKLVHLGREKMPYDTLIIATGSTPRVPRNAAGVPGVLPLRTLDDAWIIRAALADGARVAVVGGGFIGSEVASSARALGLDVTIIDPLSALMLRGLGPVVGGVLARRHADNGVRLRLGRLVAEYRGGDRVEQLLLDDGSTVDADLVVVGVGVDPAVEWLAGSGLDLSAGVVCDGAFRAAESVYAVGDVASWRAGERQRRLEHWTNAVDQASALAAVLTGTASGYDPLPYVWSDQLGSRLQVWGDILPGDDIAFFSGDADAEQFVAVAGRGGRMTGVAALGARREAMKAMRLLRAGSAWQPGVGPVVS